MAGVVGGRDVGFDVNTVRGAGFVAAGRSAPCSLMVDLELVVMRDAVEGIGCLVGTRPGPGVFEAKAERGRGAREIAFFFGACSAVWMGVETAAGFLNMGSSSMSSSER